MLPPVSGDFLFVCHFECICFKTGSSTQVSQGNLRMGGVGTDMQSCVDPTILAMFEDSSVVSEVSRKVGDR